MAAPEVAGHAAAVSAAAPPISHALRRRIVSGLMAVMVLGALDQAIVATAMPTIGDRLGDFDLLPWIVTAYMITATVMTPIFGKLADIHGRPPVLYAAMAIFTAGSIACGLAPDMTLLIVARAVQGVGAGALMSVPMTVIADMIPPRERGQFQAYFAIGYASAMIAGPLLGGLFASQLHWSLIFWINPPIVGAAYFMLAGPLRELPARHRPHRLDILGIALMSGAALTLLLALDWGGTHGWLSAAALMLFAGSAVLWAGFAWRTLNAPEPVLPFDVLRDAVVARASAASFLGIGAFVGLTVVTPIYLEELRGLTTVETALAFLVLTLGTVLGSANAGRLIRRVPRYKLLAAYGHVLSASALAGLAVAHAQLPLWAFELLLGLAAAGIGTSFPIATVAIQNAVAPHHMGIATATLGFVRSLGSSVGAALMGAIAFAGGAPAGRTQVVTVEAGAFNLVFALASVFVALTAVCFFSLEDRPLRGGPSEDARGS